MSHSTIPEQFIENLGIMSEETYNKIINCKIMIVGLGGLGGYLANHLVRLGVNHLTLVDYDQYTLSNLNRQLFSSLETVGKYKAVIIKEQMHKINPQCMIEVALTDIKDISIANKKYDYIIDAVDNLDTKKYIVNLGKKLNIPILHGACAGWYGQVGWILPNCNLIEEIYGDAKKGIEEQLKNPSFTPAVVASMMASEFVKLIQDPKKATVNRILMIDLYNNTIISNETSSSKKE